jgi:hypothetical protein
MTEPASADGFDWRGVGELAGCRTLKKPGSSPGFFCFGDHLRECRTRIMARVECRMRVNAMRGEEAGSRPSAAVSQNSRIS